YVFVPVLRRSRPEVEAVVSAVAQVQVRGFGADWGAYFEGTGARRVELPTYAFQRERFWLEVPAVAVAGRDAAEAGSVDARFWEAVEQGDVQSLAS
ncbi:hypothetical protein, partial [Streptomyces barringtoniae]|uniref:hypothetical protein n=1 Tax=Streptomyces barringtoniae TaxID=2892029 RepID=UPI001E417C5B